MEHGLGGSVGSAALATGTGVLADADAVVQGRIVPLVAGLGEVGVIGVGNVGRQAEGVCKAVVQLHALTVAQNLHEILKGMALHTADAHGANLLLVCQDANGSMGGDGIHVEDGLQLCIGAHPVIVTVGCQQAAIQTHLTALAGGHNGQLGAAEIVFHNAVLLVQQLHHIQLHQVSALALQRLGAQNHVQLLTGNDLAGGLAHLVGCQVNQQVGDHQDGIVLVLTDGDGNGGAVLAAHNAVDGKRHTGPLILLDAAVVVGLEVGNFAVLIQRLGLHVHAGGVHMGGADVRTLGKRLLANHGNHKALAAVVQINLIAGLHVHAGHGRYKAIFLSHFGGPGGCLPLGLAGIHKSAVAQRISFHFLTLLGGESGIAVLGGAEQGSTQFFSSHRSFSLSVYGLWLNSQPEHTPFIIP